MVGIFDSDSVPASVRQSTNDEPVSTERDRPILHASDVIVFRFVANPSAANTRINDVVHPEPMEKSGAPSAHRKGEGEEKEHMRLVSMLLKRKFNEFFQLFLFFPHFHRHFHFYREFDFILSQCTKTVSRSNGLRDFLHVRLKENQHQRSTVPFFCSTKEQNIATQEWKSRK